MYINHKYTNTQTRLELLTAFTFEFIILGFLYIEQRGIPTSKVIFTPP